MEHNDVLSMAEWRGITCSGGTVAGGFLIFLALEDDQLPSLDVLSDDRYLESIVLVVELEAIQSPECW
jgi:hypothetical protein